MNSSNSLSNTYTKISLENVFLIFLVLYIIYFSFEPTLFFIAWPPQFEKGLRISTYMMILLKVGYSDQVNGCRWLVCVLCTSVFLMSWMTTGYSFLIDIALLMMGCINIPYKRILKIYFFCSLFVFGVAILGSLMGSIQDLIYYDDGMYKHSFGIGYTTDFAAHFVYLLLVLWVIDEKIPPLFLSAIMAGSAAFVYSYCGARCSTIVLALSSVFVIFTWELDSFGEKNDKVNVFSKRVYRILLFSILLCMVVMIVLTMVYNPETRWLEKVNSTISGRLKLANAAIQDYGITWLGTAFEMVGFGGSTLSRIGYNFVDISYCLILVRYGALVLIVVCGLYLWTAYKAINTGNSKILVAMLLIAIHSMIEHHFIELAYNVFLLLPFSEMPCVTRRKRVLLFKRHMYFECLAYIVCIFGAFLFGPRILQYGRTLITLWRLNIPERNIYFIATIVGITLASVVLLGTLKKILFHEKIKMDQKSYLKIICCGIFILGVIWKSEKAIGQESRLYYESIKQGKLVIEKLQSDADSKRTKIYVNDIPELYYRQGVKIGRGVIMGNGLASKKNVVCLANINEEYYQLIENGYLFGELSDQQGIYTNDENAIRLIRGLGIQLHPYYSVSRSVDLRAMAKANGLEVETDGSVLLEGSAKSLEHGPWITLYKGKQKVEFKLQLLSTSSEENAVVKVRFSRNSGKKIIEEKELFVTDFDDNGNCFVTLEEETGSFDGVEFLVLVNDETRIKVLDIVYSKVDTE